MLKLEVSDLKTSMDLYQDTGGTQQSSFASKKKSTSIWISRESQFLLSKEKKMLALKHLFTLSGVKLPGSESWPIPLREIVK